MTDYASIQTVLDQLAQLETTADTATENSAETARQWKEAIQKTSEFLEDKAHPIVFIGSVGVGKSSLIGIAANLLVGATPTDRPSLKNNSVLAIGAGRTTVCEVCLRSTERNDSGVLGLVIEPYSLDDIQKEMEIFAEDEWCRHQPNALRNGEDDINPTAQEIQRFIRGMTGYVEYQQSYTEGKTRKRRRIDPLDEVAPRFPSDSEFATHLLERANLSARTSTEWWWNTSSQESLLELKTLFAAVNSGSEPTAMLPRKMTVVVPELLNNEVGKDLELTLIDTRGLDGSVESRGDLQDFLRDPRAIIVLCAPFKNAPGEELRNLLRSMTHDAELRETIPRTLLVLLDHGDADQVNGADGEREFGQAIKRDECYKALEVGGVARMLEENQIIAFDTLKDERSRLLTALDDQLCKLREATHTRLNDQLKNARRFLDGVTDQLRSALRSSVDEKLKKAMAHHLPIDIPLREPLTGLYTAIRDTRYASVIYATCRRNGGYTQLDLYAAIRAEASRAATQWLDPLTAAIKHTLSELKKDNSFKTIRDDLYLREEQYREALLQVIHSYAEQVKEQVEGKLSKDNKTWAACRREWGKGDGFKNKVLSHLENWSHRRPDITAHEHTDAVSVIPLLSEVALPEQAPRFTLHVSNLRALRQVVWSPQPLTVVIGANGAGKTTLLQVLRLLRLAYRRSLAEAVSMVLGGSDNLRSWGVNEETPIEIGIDLGMISWRIQLTPKEGSVDPLTKECLTEQGREIFSCDSLGAFSYKGVQIERGEQIGLRTLINRGAPDTALRTMAKFVQRIAVFHDLALYQLRKNGSNSSDDRLLLSRGSNALAVLRRWHQDLKNQHRYQFVVDGLNAAFPNTFRDLDFIEAGNTLAARIYAPSREQPIPLENEANGVLQLLILFCAIASAEDQSVVGIDEPENSLHPYAIRVFLRRSERWAKQHNLTVLLATHSTVLLDELSGHPEQIFVMKVSESKNMPTRLDELCNPEWLESFKLGDL